MWVSSISKLIMDKLTLNLTLLFIVLLTAFGGSYGYKAYLEQCTSHSECGGSLNCYPDPKNLNSGIKNCKCNFGYIYSTKYSNCYSMDSNSCNNDAQCQDVDLKRNCTYTADKSQRRCTCTPGTMQSPNTMKCITPPQGRFSKCQTDEDCQSSLYCYQRTKTCLCKPNYAWSPGQSSCQSMSYATCAQDSDCKDRDQNRMCDPQSERCVCKKGFSADYDSNYFCAKGKPTYNETCDLTKNCQGDLECITVAAGGRKACLCPFGYFWKAGSCAYMGSYSCQADIECQDRDKNRFCDPTVGRCSCRPGQWPNSRYLCVSKKRYNEVCPTSSDSECMDTLVCRYYKQRYTCRCPSDQMWVTAQAKCVAIGQAKCTTNDECQELDPLRACNASSQCGCKPGFYEDNDYYRTCRQQMPLGEFCVGPFQCGSPNSMCHKATCQSPSGICTCQPSHRRSGQSCIKRQCTVDRDCQSPLFDEDTNMVCGQDQKCGCRLGYSLDLIEGRCIYSWNGDDPPGMTTRQPPMTASSSRRRTRTTPTRSLAKTTAKTGGAANNKGQLIGMVLVTVVAYFASLRN